MRTFSRVCIVVAFVLAAMPSLFADSTLKGVVADSTGARIHGAVVIVHRDPAGRGASAVDVTVTVRTDANGEFSVTLPPGFYNVFVSSPAFTPFCTKIRTHDSKIVTVNSKMDLSAIVSDEIGFKVTAEPK